VKIGIVSMFSNELVLAQKFCEQGVKFADVFLVAQHRSVDGSSLVVADYAQPELVLESGHPQAEVMTRLVDRAGHYELSHRWQGDSQVDPWPGVCVYMPLSGGDGQRPC
jgi:hypothetical protein